LQSVTGREFKGIIQQMEALTESSQSGGMEFKSSNLGVRKSGMILVAT